MDLCRAKGVISYEGPVDRLGTPGKMLFGPPPSAAPKKVERDPLARKRAHYENLLMREHISNDELAQLPDGI